MSAPDVERFSGAPRRGASRHLALLNHDLRAALSDVIGGLRLVDHDALVPEARLQLERVRTAGEALARLMDQGIDPLINPSPANAGPDHIQLARLIDDLEMRWSGRAAQRRIGFAVRRSGALPTALRVDRVALERILSNALSNAIKFSDSGRVVLDIAPTACGGLSLSVSDRGPGFSAEAISQLFEYQGRPKGMKEAGQGLGLHIIREMATRIGAEIVVENQTGGGARLAVLLPKSCVSNVETMPACPSLPDLSRKKVLVADDTPTSLQLLSQMLTQMGAEVVFAHDGVQASDRLSREIFDLVVIDIEMPQLSGADVIRNLRTSSCRQRNIPILAITAHADPTEHARIRACGATSILQKPLPGIDVFSKALHTLLGTGEQSNEVTPDRNNVVNSVKNSSPQEAHAFFLCLSEDLRATAESLQQVKRTGSADLLKSCSHVLISLAGTVGAGPLLHLARRLNNVSDADTLNGLTPTIEEALAEIGQVADIVKGELLHRGMV